MMHRLPIIFVFVLVASCAEFPQLDQTISDSDRAADFPSLTNIDSLLAMAPPAQAGPSGAQVQSRLAQLRARAARLAGPVLTANERQRLQRGVAVPAAIR